MVSSSFLSISLEDFFQWLQHVAICLSYTVYVLKCRQFKILKGIISLAVWKTMGNNNIEVLESDQNLRSSVNYEFWVKLNWIPSYFTWDTMDFMGLNV